MAKRQREWAKRVRDILIIWMGGRCKRCGTIHDLEFDVIVPVNSKHSREMEWSWRMSFYRKEFERDNLQLLCGKCNLKKSNKLELQSTTPIEQPF